MSSPRVGWTASMMSGLRENSRARITFCWLPPDSVPIALSREPARTENCSSRRSALRAMTWRSSVPHRANGRSAWVCSTRLSAIESSDTRPVRCRSWGTCPSPASTASPGADAGAVAAVDRHPSGARRPQAGDRLREFGLAVAVDPGDADDLAAPDAQRNAAQRLEAARVAAPEILDVQHRSARRDIAGGLGARHVPPHHHPGEPVAARIGRPLHPDHAPAAQHGHAVAKRRHLVQLVGDEDDAVAGVPQAVERGEEFVDLLGREHRGRLVEDEGVGAAKQRLEDFHPLLHADRQLGHPRIDVHGEVVGSRGVDHPAPELREIEQRLVLRAQPEDDVLQHAERGAPA